MTQPCAMGRNQHDIIMTLNFDINDIGSISSSLLTPRGRLNVRPPSHQDDPTQTAGSVKLVLAPSHLPDSPTHLQFGLGNLTTSHLAKQGLLASPGGFQLFQDVPTQTAAASVSSFLQCQHFTLVNVTSRT